MNRSPHRWWLLLVLVAAVLVGSDADARTRRHRRVSAPPPPRPLRAASAAPIALDRAAGDAVLVALGGSGRWALAVIWPRPETLDAGAHPRAAVEVAAQAVIDSATAGFDDSAAVDAIVRLVPEGVMVGFTVPSGGARLDQLLAAAERLATPGAIDADSVDDQLARLTATASALWNEPSAVARAATLITLYPGYEGFRSAPDELAEVRAEDSLTAIADVRTRRVAFRAVGPSGLAAAIASRLRDRLAAPAAAPTPLDNPTLPFTVAIVRRAEDDPTVAMTVGFRAQQASDDPPPDSLALFAEALDEGDASLPQRLALACGAAVKAGARYEQVGARGGALLFEAVVPRACAAQALAVMQGTIDSMHALPLRDDVVANAWTRRERTIDALLTDPLNRLDALVYSPGQVWPPALRQRRELHGAALTAAARTWLDRDSMAVTLAGAWPDEALPGESQRVAWERFSVGAPRLERELTLEEESAQFARAGEALARELLTSLSDGHRSRVAAGHSALYRVNEQTPLGDAEARLQVNDAGGETSISLHRDTWTLEAAAAVGNAEVEVRGGNGVPAPKVSGDRIALAALRQPAVLAQAVLDGRLVGFSALASCAEGTCPALRAEPGDGSRLLLLLDGQTRLPTSLRVWWSGTNDASGPDEEVAYLAWSRFGEMRIASDLQVDDALGGHRRLTLLDWNWAIAP